MASTASTTIGSGDMVQRILGNECVMTGECREVVLFGVVVAWMAVLTRFAQISAPKMDQR
jgi:hypothetical protein